MPEAQPTTSPHCVTCQVLDPHPVQDELQRHALEERDDEVEFTRIPIAGEDNEDYMSDNESDSNNDEAIPVFTQNMTRIILQPEATGPNMDEDTTIPIVEPLLPNPYMQVPTGFATPPPTVADPIALDFNILTGDDIAFLIGRADGVVATHELTPNLTHKNIYTTLPEVCDKINFTQNKQGMIKGDHKRKLTEEEKRMTKQTNFSDLADNAVPPTTHDERPQTL
jgi:hypothetical protein